MYADVYRDSILVDLINLVTFHGVNHSTFTFDYSPIYFGNYSFDFFLNDPYYTNPQYICNATFEYRDPTPDPDPDPYTEFTWAILTTETRIEVSITGHYVFVSGNRPIIGGSMYAYTNRDGDYMDLTNLVTSHNFNSSTFIFDYSPVYFGNYSFDFYLNDPFLATPQLICNATFEYRNPPPDPDPYTEFTWIVLTTESRIKVNITGYSVFPSGHEPIFGGSMYTYVYRDGNYIDEFELVTNHNFYDTLFKFDYSPTYFGNYSFDFYLNDPNLLNPQLICNATFEYQNPDPAPDPDDPDPDDDPINLYEGDATVTLPLALGMIGAATIPLFGTYKAVRSKKSKNKQTSKY